MTADEMDEQRKQNIAYEYLCHLEESKVWVWKFSLNFIWLTWKSKDHPKMWPQIFFIHYVAFYM